MIPDQVRADSVAASRVLDEFNAVPVRTVAQQAGMPVPRSEAALLFLQDAGLAATDDNALWRKVT